MFSEKLLILYAMWATKALWPMLSLSFLISPASKYDSVIYPPENTPCNIIILLFLILVKFYSAVFASLMWVLLLGACDATSSR